MNRVIFRIITIFFLFIFIGSHSFLYAQTKAEVDAAKAKFMEAMKNKDLVLAKNILTSFAEKGYAKFQEKLGELYLEGHLNTPIDYKEAIKWFKLAAEQGDAEAQKNLKRAEKLEKQRIEEERIAAKQEKEKAAKQVKFNKIMEEAEKYRTAVKKLCENKEDVSKCITISSCVVAAIIEGLKHDDRGKKFKKTVEGSLLSKGSVKKAMEELKKSAEKDELLKIQFEQSFMMCAR